MRVLLFSLCTVVAAVNGGPLVNLTSSLVQPIGETFSTAVVTAPTPHAPTDASPLEQTPLPIFSPVSVETSIEGLIIPDQSSQAPTDVKDSERTSFPILRPLGVHTAIEGILIPEPAPMEEKALPEDALTFLLSGILPLKIAGFVAKIVTLAVTMIALIFVGKSITAALSKLLIGKVAVDVLSKSAADEAVDRVRRAVEILQLGIQKYEGIQGLGELYSNFLD